eukprot:TRINITY_DN2467_c0_g3_i1.p1 TRINITY_DN2467_c0_g3~~TRINITY_DN2467_c0_g3_i1.p1  ORF type:complete len:1653 (+),score=416.81 TRINITY_DN2467_c0_g3_i1:99-5057(+)
MWMGRASPRCHACMSMGKPGPWCVADRPCTFQNSCATSSPASSGRAVSSPQRQRSVGSPPRTSTGLRPFGSVASRESSLQQRRKQMTAAPPPPQRGASTGRGEAPNGAARSPTPDGASAAGRQLRSLSAPSASPQGGISGGTGGTGGTGGNTRMVPPSPKLHTAGRTRTASPGNGSAGPPARSYSSRGLHTSSKGQLVNHVDDIPEIEYRLELDIFRKLLNAQVVTWKQVQIAATHVLKHDGVADDSMENAQEDRSHGKSAGVYFQKLVANAIEQSLRLQESFDQVVEKKRWDKENGKPADLESNARAECARLNEERAVMTREMVELHYECERLDNNMAECRADCERRLAEGRAELGQKTGALVREHQTEMERHSSEIQRERERLESEKADTMQKFRLERERAMKEEEEKMAQKVKRLHEECERKISDEMAKLERRLSDSRAHAEDQLRKERQVTDRIMHVLRELPPLQAAMELGDLNLLEEELRKWKSSSLPEHFGECKGVVEAVLKLARERLLSWRGVEATWRDVLKEAESLPGSLSALTRLSQRIFRTLKESQLTLLDVRRSDPKALERCCEVLEAWQSRSMAHPNHVQRLIIRKAMRCSQLGAFDFADLDICLRLVDREGSEVFLSRAKALVDDDGIAPQRLRPLLAHLETMLFFLKYTTSEDLQLAHNEFKRRMTGSETEAEVSEYLKWAEKEYPPGCELVRISEGRDLMNGKTVATVLRELRRPPGFWKRDGLGPFREIFYQWAVAMQGTFDLLVLPHHTQVICLLAFQRFLETPRGPQALIAQVGTGEGKSMIIAALAIYVVVVLRKKAHVVVDDETLLERDFGTFKSVFDAFELPALKGTGKRKLNAVLCVSEERLAGRRRESGVATRVDPEADICYCEAKHVQSYYASLARSERPDFDAYRNLVLILDEVDALVIDEEPNDVFVYPNNDLSRMATSVAGALAQTNAALQQSELAAIQNSPHPAAKRVVAEMTSEWAAGKQLAAGEHFAYSKELGRYCKLLAGRSNPKAWSLALECRNFQDGHSKTITFQERLFVTSRPRVYRKYHRILGLSGSIGSVPEQAFLRSTYQAAFFKVPPFLTTCRGSPFHEAQPVRLGQRQRFVYVEPTPEAQACRLAEVALDARERVPVLIIAKDRACADQLVEQLRRAARSRGLGTLSDDVVRSLSRNLYETNPEQWKENLNRATLALGDGSECGGKTWRITVTDPRGGRGTDYRVDDQAVDAQGGLLLIPAVVPTSRRDWTQFLGRTARQDCKGQYCCVLCGADYQALSNKYKEPLHAESPDGGLSVVETILRWGDREAAERIQRSAALYNSGVRMNELCEDIFAKHPELTTAASSRELLVEACQRVRWMSTKDVDEAFARLPDYNPAKVPTDSRDAGRPEGVAAVASAAAAGAGAMALHGAAAANGGGRIRGLSPVAPPGRQGATASRPAAPKVVFFCLDWSASMMSQDTGTRLSRFETCVQCVLRILREQVRECDLVGVLGFGPGVQLVVPPTLKGKGGRQLEAAIAALRPQMAGGTCFFDAVAQCLHLLAQSPAIPKGASRWLVTLTDGDDLGSQPQNARGELVSQMLAATAPRHLNLVAVTVGPLKAVNMQVINSWVQRVRSAGGVGRLLSEKDAATIARAFDVVAEYLAGDIGGVVEC